MAVLISSGTRWIALTARAWGSIEPSAKAARIFSTVSGSLALTKVAPMSPAHSTRHAVHAEGSISFGL